MEPTEYTGFKPVKPFKMLVQYAVMERAEFGDGKDEERQRYDTEQQAEEYISDSLLEHNMFGNREFYIRKVYSKE